MNSSSTVYSAVPVGRPAVVASDWIVPRPQSTTLTLAGLLAVNSVCVAAATACYLGAQRVAGTVLGAAAAAFFLAPVCVDAVPGARFVRDASHCLS